MRDRDKRVGREIAAVHIRTLLGCSASSISNLPARTVSFLWSRSPNRDGSSDKLRSMNHASQHNKHNDGCELTHHHSFVPEALAIVTSAARWHPQQGRGKSVITRHGSLQPTQPKAKHAHVMLGVVHALHKLRADEQAEDLNRVSHATCRAHAPLSHLSPGLAAASDADDTS